MLMGDNTPNTLYLQMSPAINIVVLIGMLFPSTFSLLYNEQAPTHQKSDKVAIRGIYVA
jgi:hypothetical protein